MRQLLLLLLALTSAIAAGPRPRYGGSLQVELAAAGPSRDPAEPIANGAVSARRDLLSRLTFETLTGLDDRGRPQPLLATSWQHDSDNKVWRFTLRAGVAFHDGSALTAAAAVQS